MSMNPPEMAPDELRPVPKRKMSTTAKVLIILGLVFGVLVVLCCGGVIWVIYSVAHSFSDDPATTATVAAQITDIDVPDGLRPAGSMDMKLPIVGRIMAAAFYQDTTTHSGLILLQMKAEYRDSDEAEIRRLFNQSLGQQNVPEEEEVLIQESSQKQVVIRGQPAAFTIAKGKGAKSGNARIQVTGLFPGKTGVAMLMINADAKQYPEETIIKTIESIK
jgi:hypothetical protein